MKRQSPASSMKRWIAHGPPSDFASGWSSSPSFQKVSAERNENSRLDRKLNTTGSAGACACAQESTVLVVPKSSPSARGAPPWRLATRSAIDLHAGVLELLAQLVGGLLHGLAERVAGDELRFQLVLL